MARTARLISSADIYHVVIRGSGRRIIFEEDDDRLLFLRLLGKYLTELGGEVFAWTLMSNHVHMVVHMPLSSIALLMKKLGATYFTNFNTKACRSGHVLQDRFHSEAIDSDEYLMTCIRYVHQNIEKAGACSMETYEWSSYGAYVGNAAETGGLMTKTDFVLAVFGGVEEFKRFHSFRNYAVPCIDIGKTRVRMSDDEALVFARSLVGEDVFRNVGKLDKDLRDAKLRLLKDNGLGVRQIERLTGIGRSIVSRAQ